MMHYLIPAELTIDWLEGTLLDELSCQPGPAVDSEAIYYDTFDWAVYRDGGLLAHADGMLHWCDHEGSHSCSQPLEDTPGFVRDVPAGAVRARIESPCGIRRLLPMMRILTHTRRLQLRDRGDQPLVRLSLDSHRFEDAISGRTGDLSARLRIESTPGGAKAERAVIGFLENHLGLSAPDQPLLAEAVMAAGRRPADYSSKIDYRLHPRQRADKVTKQILLALLQTLEAKIEGTRKGWDTEFLHDLRVATRRTRTALGQIKGVLLDQMVEHYKERFAWLQQITGPVRDLDVYLLAFEDYRDSLPEPLRPRLEPLRTFLRAHYEDAQSTLASTLGSSDFKDLIAEWRIFLTAPAPECSPLPNAMQPIKSVADARIRRLAKRVRREGRAIDACSPPEALHELRKSCKKLRYLMEFFQSLYPEPRIRPLIKQIKVLLEQLGAFQDLAVQASHLETIAKQMHAEGVATTDSLLAMGALIGDLLARQRHLRAGFTNAFADFDEHRHWREYKALFRKASETGSTR